MASYALQGRRGREVHRRRASATYQWNDQWATTVRGAYDRLVGSAADSPITRNLGSRDQFTVGASASYSFQLGGGGWRR